MQHFIDFFVHSQWSDLKWHTKSKSSSISPRIPVTTKIITCLVKDPYYPLLATVSGRGSILRYVLMELFHFSIPSLACADLKSKGALWFWNWHHWEWCQFRLDFWYSILLRFFVWYLSLANLSINHLEPSDTFAFSRISHVMHGKLDSGAREPNVYQEHTCEANKHHHHHQQQQQHHHQQQQHHHHHHHHHHHSQKLLFTRKVTFA